MFLVIFFSSFTPILFVVNRLVEIFLSVD